MAVLTSRKIERLVERVRGLREPGEASGLPEVLVPVVPTPTMVRAGATGKTDSGRSNIHLTDAYAALAWQRMLLVGCGMKDQDTRSWLGQASLIPAEAIQQAWAQRTGRIRGDNLILVPGFPTVNMFMDAGCFDMGWRRARDRTVFLGDMGAARVWLRMTSQATEEFSQV